MSFPLVEWNFNFQYDSTTKRFTSIYQTANPTWNLCYLLLSLFCMVWTPLFHAAPNRCTFTFGSTLLNLVNSSKTRLKKNLAFNDYLTDDSGWWVFQTCFSHVKIRTSQVKHLQILPGFGGFALWKVKNIEKCGVKSQTKKSSLPFKKRSKFLTYWNHQLTHLRKHVLTTFSQPGCLSLKAA